MARRGSSQAVKTAEAVRDARIMELYCQGKTQADIAGIVGLSSQRVTQIIAKERQEAIARKSVSADDKLEVELRKLDELDEAAKLGWENSLKSSTSVLTRKVKPRQDKKISDKRLETAGKELALITVSQEETVTTVAGDPRFLKIRLDTVDKKLRLLNAYPKEEKTEVNNVVQINWGDLANFIVSVEPLPETPSSEIEKRIAAELPPSNNGNGNGQSH